MLQAELARRRRPEGALPERARSTSSCSAARPTTTTPSSSTTARCRCCSPTSTPASWSCAVRPDGHGQGRHAALGRRGRAGAHGQPAVGQLHRRPRRTAVLSPYDGLSIGILSSLKGVGYGSADMPMPIVTGQDAEVPSVKSILAGEQYSTVFKDTRELAKVTVGMVDAVLAGKRARDQRHQDLRQRRQGRAVLPAEAGRGRRVELEGDPGRQRLLHRGPGQVS